MASLIDELVLLAYDDDTGRCRTSHIDVGLGGAVLLELTLAERVDVVGGKVQVTDETPTGDAVVDERLRRLAGDKPRRPSTVVQQLGRRLRQTALDDLVARKVLRAERGKVLGIFPETKYLPNSPSVEAEVRDRLSRAVRAGRADDARTAAIASLVFATQLSHVAVPEGKGRETRKALKKISQGSWAGEATRKAVEAAQAAVMASIAAATAATTTASGS